MRHKEEVKFAFNDLRLLNEARVDVGSLRRVVNEVLAVIAWCLLEEALADTLVHDNEGDIGRGLRRTVVITTIFHLNNSVQLFKLLVNDLLSHGVTNTISVDKDMARHGSIVKVTVGLETAREVV